MPATQQLHDLGQSLWIDNITRDMLKEGTLQQYIEELSLTGLTSNPTIFQKAIKSSKLYDDSILELRNQGREGEQLFSEFAACHSCGISMPPLSTQLFSFNNPLGACGECGGLGVKQFFDESLIVPDHSLSVIGGAIAPWGWRNESTYTGQMLAAVAKHYGFSLKTLLAP